MKKLYRVSVLIMVFGSMVFAGGGKDLRPPYVPPVAVYAGGFYAGVGVSGMSLRNDLSDEEFSTMGVMLQIGYQFNPYFAVEGRYTHSVGDVKYDRGITSNPNYSAYPTDFTNVGIYLKPTISLDNLVLYGLLGYGEVKLTNIPLGPGSADRAESGFQWGVGAEYRVSKDISIFVDYVRFYDDKGFDYRATTADIVSDAWNVAAAKC